MLQRWWQRVMKMIKKKYLDITDRYLQENPARVQRPRTARLRGTRWYLVPVRARCHLAPRASAIDRRPS